MYLWSQLGINKNISDAFSLAEPMSSLPTQSFLILILKDPWPFLLCKAQYVHDEVKSTVQYFIICLSYLQE